jgi:hypothetical protein
LIGIICLPFTDSAKVSHSQLEESTVHAAISTHL